MPNAKINYNLIGSRIREAREKARLDQQELSAALSVEYQIELSSKIIHKVEKGQRPVRDAELIAIASVLEVDPNWLCSWEG